MVMYQQVCTGTKYQQHQRNAAKVGSNLFLTSTVWRKVTSRPA